MLVKLIKKYASSAFSGYTSIILAVLVSALLTYLTTLNISINNQKQTITDLSNKNGALEEKIINQAESNNEKIEKEVILKNISILEEENKRLIKQNEQLKNLTEEKEKDMQEINNELNKIKNKECLNSVVDSETVKSLNKIFNGE